MEASVVRTLFVALALIDLQLCLALALFWKTQKTYPGFGFWVACSATQVAYGMLFALGDATSDSWSLAPAYVVMTLAAVFRLEGVKRFLGAPSVWRPNFLAPVVVLFLLAFFTGPRDDMVVRNLIVTFTVVGFLARSVWLLGVHEAPAKALFWTLAGLQIVRAVGLIARSVTGIVWPVNLPLFAATPANVSNLLITGLLDVGVTICYLMLNSQRLAQDLQVAQHDAEEYGRKLERDIAERKQVEEERERLIKELDAFAHTVAHDLKNSITLIMGYAEMYSLQPGPAPQDGSQELAENVTKAARKMNRVVEELLLLARVRGTDVERTPLEMEDIVAEACRRLSEAIRALGATVAVPATWPGALGYGPWIEEVWVNYLSNALKYGGRPPCIELGAAVQPDGMVRFWARDNGPGLTPEDRGRLFTPFSRLSQSSAKGHGLGLSIVRRIVEKLDGQVGITSTGLPGEGCDFFFTLPGVNGHDMAGSS